MPAASVSEPDLYSACASAVWWASRARSGSAKGSEMTCWLVRPVSAVCRLSSQLVAAALPVPAVVQWQPAFTVATWSLLPSLTR